MIKLTPDEIAARDKWFEEHDPNGDGFDCSDNYRYAHKGNEEEEAAYRKAMEYGCCGSVDTELVLPNGQILLFGFNYGH